MGCAQLGLSEVARIVSIEPALHSQRRKPTDLHCITRRPVHGVRSGDVRVSMGAREGVGRGGAIMLGWR